MNPIAHISQPAQLYEPTNPQPTNPRPQARTEAEVLPIPLVVPVQELARMAREANFGGGTEAARGLQSETQMGSQGSQTQTQTQTQSQTQNPLNSPQNSGGSEGGGGRGWEGKGSIDLVKEYINRRADERFRSVLSQAYDDRSLLILVSFKGFESPSPRSSPSPPP